MSAGAHHPRSPSVAGPPSPAGFTLLEIMVSLLIVGSVALIFLQVQGQSSDKAFIAEKSLMAMRYVDEIIAEHMLDPELYDEAQMIVEDDPMFVYVLTVEEFDLATGRKEDEDETNLDGGFTAEFQSGFNNDYGGDEDEDEEDQPHLVRRIHIEMFYPSLGEDPARLEIETFIPRVTERQDDDGFDFGR